MSIFNNFSDFLNLGKFVPKRNLYCQIVEVGYSALPVENVIFCQVWGDKILIEFGFTHSLPQLNYDMSRSAAMIIAVVMDSILNKSDCNVTLSYCREKVLDLHASGILVVLLERYQFERNSLFH